MNISYKWLKRYIDFELSPEELAAALTSLGLECDTIEEVESIRGGLRGIVIGKVLTCVEHPNSDHLHITTCDLGTGEPVQIVCGAPNVAAGKTVVVATVGTTLYDGDKEFQIKKSKIRGVESFGMICAEDEIGVGTSHDGIMVLADAEDVKPGTPAAEYFKLDSDYMLEVELTPNRVDGASHYGVARDLKAWLHRHGAPQAEVFTPDVSEVKADRAEGATPVEVEDVQGCPRYSGITVRGVKVTESPDWLKSLLIAAGQRPINSIVDITNFVLLGMGQPLHCFDLNKVAGQKIVVRTCQTGTKFTTLDGVEHTLDASDLMICDAQKPLCIAGVFGGLDSGVTEATTDVFIESAYFNPTRVRKSARRHGLSTDASFRYERGTDPDITVYTAKLAAKLIKEIAGGEICGEPVDVCSADVEPFKVTLDLGYARRLIGKDIPTDEIIQILTSLDINIVEENADVLELRVPRYRVDVQRPCDVVEEILRVYGYNNVEIPDHMDANLSIRTNVDESYTLQDKVSNTLSAAGFREIMNNSLTAVSYYDENEQWPRTEGVELMNPLSSDLGIMRQTLLYGGLETIAHNINRKAADLRLYEFGNVYHRNPAAESTAEKPLAPFSEELHLALWLTGKDVLPSWNTQERKASVFDLKGIVLNLFAILGIPGGAVKLTQETDTVYSACLRIDTRSGQRIGSLGVLNRKQLQKFSIAQEVFYAELSWPAIMKLSLKNNPQYTDLPRTQPVIRDLALLLDKAVSFAQVENIVRSSEKKLLRKVSLFDVYEGDKLPAGKKSYAITITLQDDEKTLQDKQIDAVMNKIISNLQKQLGAELR
ncbi:MAG: phenylalanine--tRNA ligase subunit beta [Prevotella sp.]|nr:phenylalanine--tRNA ligase subunit beta [Prevotella sp.]MCM1075461.1 phenylalanine--tRNA ligase subunit beta [Ruminococcus sp.]